jgi:hypothetical protein
MNYDNWLFKKLDYSWNGGSIVESKDENNRRVYVTPEGNRYPSVTTVISAREKPELKKWKEKVGVKEAEAIKKRAGNRGTKVHKLAEYYITNDPLFTEVVKDPFIQPIFQKIKEKLDLSLKGIYDTEVGLYSDYLRTAGRCDLICDYSYVLKRNDNIESYYEPVILDFKSKNKFIKYGLYKEYYKQIAAYKVMWKERTGIDIKKGVVIYATDSCELYEEIFDIDPWIEEFKKDRGLFFKINGY